MARQVLALSGRKVYAIESRSNGLLIVRRHETARDRGGKVGEAKDMDAAVGLIRADIGAKDVDIQDG